MDDSARHAYRGAFGEYASKLDALQRLMESGGPDNGHLETAMEEVERARQAHNEARDRLAGELDVRVLQHAEAALRQESNLATTILPCT